MAATARAIRTRPGWMAGLCALALVCGGISPQQAGAQDSAPAETAPPPDTDPAELIAAASALETRIAKVLAEIDAEILRLEEAAAADGSMETLTQIDALQDRRDALALRLEEVRALVVALEEVE